MSPAIIALLACVCCMCLLGLTVGIYFAMNSEESGSPAPAPALTPLQTLRNSGTKLEPAELDIGALTAPRAVTTQPTGLTGPANFTISMDLTIEKEPPTWVDILQNVTGGTWPLDNADKRKPLIHLSGVGSGYTSKSIIMSLNTKPGTEPADNNFWVDSAENNGWTFTPGTKFNFTATHNATSKKIAVYINGVGKNEKTMPSAMVYAATNNFTWRPFFSGQDSGYMKVNNAYFFKKVLSQAEITTLQGGTSTYMPQPLSMGTSAYVKDDFASY
jgi:hypothetical protein